MAVRSMVVLAGRYRLEAPLGRGGMGEVWRGVDLRLRRPVAVKIFPLTAAAEPADVGRFRHEAEAAAALNHPGITTVFDVDEHRDGEEHWLFLVMELLVGRDLRHLIAGHPEGLPVERVRDLALQITEALGAAHRGGVVHRDIKPANLFLLDEGRLKICDFGIARIADATRITATGSTAGTPMYMAPEQIQSATMDHRTDLYAFGCVLYELLTGKPWIPADSNIAAILYQHLNQPPPSPKSVRAEIPDEFDALVLELLAKQPDDRPEDAAAVTERLREFLAEPSRPPQDEPPSEEPSDLPVTSEPDPAEPKSDPPDPKPDSPDSKPELSDERPVVPDAEQPAPASETASPPASRRIGRRTVLLGGLGAAVVAGVGVPTAWFLLNDDSPVTTFAGHTDAVDSVVFSPDGKRLATGSWDGTARLWDVETGRTIRTFAGHAGAVDSVVFSPDGERLATGSYDGAARLWDVETGRTIRTFADTRHVDSVVFSPDGGRLATGSWDGAARLWDVGTGRKIHTFGDTDNVYSVAFSPNGKMLATGIYFGASQLWDVGTGRTIRTFTGRSDAVDSVVFSPDGKRLAVGGSDGAARLWDVGTGRTIRTFTGHSDAVDSVVFSPDGKTLATGSRDGTARLWDVGTGRTIRAFGDTRYVVYSVAFSPDGETLVTGSGDKTALLWAI